MVIYNGSVDPYSPEASRYECVSCGARVDSGGRCERCGNESLVNIAIPRE